MRIGSVIKLVVGLVVFLAIFMAGFTAGGMVTSNGMVESDKIADCLPVQDIDELQACVNGESATKEGQEPSEQATEPSDGGEQATEPSDGGEQTSAATEPSEGAQEPAEEEETLSEDEAHEEMEEAMSNVLWEPRGKWVYNEKHGDWEFQVEGIYAGVQAAGEPDREPTGSWDFDYDDDRWIFTPEEG